MTWKSVSRTVGPVASEYPSLSRGEQTRARLLEAAVEVLERKGYHAVRVDDIVKAARTSHGTFYLYFANKEALIRDLIEEVAAEFAQIAAALPHLDQSQASVVQLRRWIHEFSAVHSRRSAVVRAWTEIAAPGDPAAALGRSVLSMFVVALGDRITALHPECTAATATLTAATIVAMLERTNYYVLTGHLRSDQDAVVESLARATYAIVAAQTDDRPPR